jgi:Ion channel
VKKRRSHSWPVVTALTRFWADDKGLSIFSALLLVIVFVLPPLVRPGSGRSLAGDVVFALVLVSGVLALAQRRLARLLLMPAAVIALAVDLGSWVLPVPQPWVQGTGLLSLLLLLVVVLAQTLRSGPITHHRIQGAIAAYLLLGVIWAYAYSLVALLHPDAFSGPVRPADGPRGFFYLSFVTLTTVGYGDVLPVHPTARSLAVLEAVTGPLYLAILISRLVSLEVAPRPR